MINFLRRPVFLISLFLLIGSVCVLCATEIFSNSDEIHVIRLDDATINPVTADYIVNAIDSANENNITCLIIELDTPGGLLTSTRSIVKKILS